MDKLALYDKLVATQPSVTRKGAMMPYTSVNGHMFSVLTADGTFALRLSTQDRDAFVAKYGTKPVVMNGAVMEDYVEVPDALLTDTATLARYFAASLAHVASLKPKPTTRKAAAKPPSANKSAAKETAAKKPAAKQPAAKKKAPRKKG